MTNAARTARQSDPTYGTNRIPWARLPPANDVWRLVQLGCPGAPSGGPSVRRAIRFDSSNRRPYRTALVISIFRNCQYVGAVRNCHGRMIVTGKRMRKEVKSTHAAAIAVLALLYFVTARTSQLFAIPPGHISPVWIPSGLILAAMLVRRGRKEFPMINTECPMPNAGGNESLGDWKFLVGYWSFADPIRKRRGLNRHRIPA